MQQDSLYPPFSLKKDMKPTQEYPKVLYFLTKKIGMSEKKRAEVLDSLFWTYRAEKVGYYYQRGMKVDSSLIDKLARNMAEEHVDRLDKKGDEINKIVVNNRIDEQIKRQIEESQDNFLQWIDNK